MILFPPLMRRRASLGALTLGLALGMPAHLSAQEAPKKELSEKVSEELGKIKTQTDAKNYDAAIAILDGLLKNAKSDSYDAAIINQVKAQILLTKGDYGKSIEPLELAVSISDKYNFFDSKTTLDLVYYLAQLYYQEATTTKSKDDQTRFYEKANTYIARWIKTTPKVTPDSQLFYASLLYNQAQLNPEKPDMALVKRAQEETEKGLLLSTKPKDTFYILLLATLQQQGEVARSAEVLELLVKMYPNNKTYWQQLASTYLNLQQDVRAVLTLERAQALGHMNTPKDNFNLVGIYFNMQQYDYAIGLLETGLRNNTIENEQRNWELLAASYQQVRKEFKAIEILKEATKLYPEAGSLDLQIAQLYYSLDNTAEAYKFAKSATVKKLDKPWQAQTFLAYMAFEEKKLEEALLAVNEGMKAPDGAKDAERLKRAIEDAIKEREALKNAASA